MMLQDRVTRFFLVLAAIGALTLASGCQETSEPAPGSQAGTPPDPENATYTIENSPVTLIDGIAKTPATHGATSKVVTRIWGEPTTADLQQDGVDDAVLILVHSPGGSGTFYYLAAAIGSPDGSSGTAGLFLGDRIDPQAVEFRDGRIIVRYLTRAGGESFADQPTVEEQRDFLYKAESGGLVEVAQDFEGEAD
jgi:hypothetical protein